MLSLSGLSPTEYLQAQYEKRSRLLECHAQKQGERDRALTVRKDDANLRTFIQDIMTDEDCEAEEAAAAATATTTQRLNTSKPLSQSSSKLNSKVMPSNLNIRIQVPLKVWTKVIKQLNKYKCEISDDTSGDEGREDADADGDAIDDAYEEEDESDGSSGDEIAEWTKRSGKTIPYRSHDGEADAQNGWQTNRAIKFSTNAQSIKSFAKMKSAQGLDVFMQQNENFDWHSFKQAKKSNKKSNSNTSVKNVFGIRASNRIVAENQVEILTAIKKDVNDALKANKNGKENKRPTEQSFVSLASMPFRQALGFQYCNAEYEKSATPCCQFHAVHSLILLKALQEIGQPATPQELINFITKVSHVQASVVFQIVHTMLDWAESASFVRRISDFYYINYNDLFHLHPELFCQLNQPESTAKLCQLNEFVGSQELPLVNEVLSNESKKKLRKRRKKRSKKEHFWRKKKSKKLNSEPPKKFLLY